MSNPTIAEQASQFAEQMASQPQSDVFSVFATEQVELETRGVARRSAARARAARRQRLRRMDRAGLMG
jgi:hypothetical protein